MSNSEIEQSGTVKGHLPNEASLSGRISNGLSLSGHISIGSGAGDFIIKMTVTSDGDYNYTVTSCDATVEQIDAAVADGKRVVVIASIDGSILELPMLQGVEGNTYYFGAFSGSQIVTSFVEKIGNTSNWEFDMSQIQSEDVGYSNAALPSGTTNVRGALDELVPKSHTHSNKAILDKFSETNGKPTYDGEALGGGSEKEIFKIPVTVTELEEPADGEHFKVEHTITSAEIETAVEEGKTLSVLADRRGVTYNLPLFYYVSGIYCFYAMAGSTAMYVVVGQPGDEGETPKEVWQYIEDNQIIEAGNVYYHNSNNPSLDSTKKALDKLLTDSHTHANKDTLDKLSVSNGKLQYNGSDVGLKGADGTDGKDGITPTIGTNGNWYLGTTDTGKPSRGEKGDTGAAGADGYTPVKGTDYWTTADKAEIVNDTLAALPTWTGGSY